LISKRQTSQGSVTGARLTCRSVPSRADVELLATVGALDNSPAERFVEASQGVGSIQVDGGMTEQAGMRLDGADQRYAKSVASAVGFNE
jgi:hypothetical protein